VEKILIVDDSHDSRALLSLILKKEGFIPREVTDGSLVPAACRQELPDLILLDILMPGKDGYETCRELKSSPETQHIPIIFLSAQDSSSDKVKGLYLGAADYITKPFDKAEVIARVKTQLKIYNLTNALAESNRQLQKKQAKIDEDLAAAAQIQTALIPAASPVVEKFNFSWKFIPSDLSGGDIFNIHVLDDQTLVVYLADVSGHGVPAAMVTVSIAQSLQPHGTTVLRRTVESPARHETRPPVEVLRILNREFPIERFDKYFTISYITIDRCTGKIRYSSAGHPPPLLLRASGSLELLEEGGPMIGLGDLFTVEEGENQLQKGDRLFLYTDGITEHCLGDDFFGSERLHNELIRTKDLPLDQACGRVINQIYSFGEYIKAIDDITLLALEYTG
jgi:sigma-B regulation protein RsbU (phosphoserine phosphatase)